MRACVPLKLLFLPTLRATYDVIFLLFQFRHVKQTQVAFTPLCWLTFLITSACASMFSVYQKRRSTREWHLPIVIMEEKNLMDRESCLSTVRELRCHNRGTWISSIATSTLRSQLIKIPILSYKYKLRSQVLELRWTKKLRCPLWSSLHCKLRQKPKNSIEKCWNFTSLFLSRFNWSLARVERSFKPDYFWSGHFYSRNLALRQHGPRFPRRSTGPDRC